MIIPETTFILMHKDIALCEVNLSSDGSMSKIRRYDSGVEHFPLGGQMNDVRFHEWWKDRAIPRTRRGAKYALERLGYATTASALVNNLGLSLNDCYWIKPRKSDLTWKDVSLFTNPFTDTFGELTFNSFHRFNLKEKTLFHSAATQGELQKKWCIHEDGRRFLVKGNIDTSFQQSINEVFATRLHEQQGFSHHVPYYLTDVSTEGERNALGCMCFNFCSEEVESISAWEVLQSVKMRPSESYYHTFKRVCLSLGISEASFDTFMDYEIMTDYLLTNTDRHMNNIAILRNPDTLKVIGLAPIYDSGNSMFFNASRNSLQRVHFNQIKSHSFLEKEVRLLQYVINRDAVDLNKAQMDFSLYEEDMSEHHWRIPLLENLYQKKLRFLESFQSGKDIWKSHHAQRNPELL